MDTDKIPTSLKASPWMPMRDPVMIALFSKALEESSELLEVYAKYTLYSHLPDNGPTAVNSLAEEMGDLLALMSHIIVKCDLGSGRTDLYLETYIKNGATDRKAAMLYVLRLQKVLSRCLMQGLDDMDPTWHAPNRHMLAAIIDQCRGYLYAQIRAYLLDRDAIDRRVARKYLYLQDWFNQIAEDKPEHGT